MDKYCVGVDVGGTTVKLVCLLTSLPPLPRGRKAMILSVYHFLDYFGREQRKSHRKSTDDKNF